MALGVGNIMVLICIVISIIFAIVTHQATNALWWALLAIFAVLWWDARAPWGAPWQLAHGKVAARGAACSNCSLFAGAALAWSGSRRPPQRNPTAA